MGKQIVRKENTHNALFYVYNENIMWKHTYSHIDFPLFSFAVLHNEIP